LSYVLGIVGSKRRLGNCDVLTKLVMQQCERSGVSTKLVYLDEFGINTCRGCLRCVIKGSCPQKDDMEKLLEIMLGATGLVLAAPTYLFSASGVIKTIIDRALMLSSFLSELDVSRRAVTISVAGNELWNPLGSEFLNQFCFAYGFTVTDYLQAYSPGPAEVLLENQYVSAAKRLAKNLSEPNTSRRNPEKNQCPVCYSKTVSYTSNDKIRCSFCLTEAKINGQGSLTFNVEKGQESFWTPEHRRKHLEDWILVTRDKFLENRNKVKDELLKLNYKAGETKNNTCGQ